MVKHAAFWLICIVCISPVFVFGYPGPLPGTEDIPKLYAASALVCKGEVTDAPNPVFVESPTGLPRRTATANVRLDRCFKGTQTTSSIPVLIDAFRSCCNASFVLRKGDYRLLFLKPENGAYAIVDDWFGSLPVSRLMASSSADADGMYLLELDLKAGLQDSDPDRVLDSIRMLGNMKKLRSTAELKALLDNPDMMVKTRVWQALLRLKDYSVLPAVTAFFDSQPDLPHELFLPRDRLFEMQSELQMEMAGVSDATALPYLEKFATNGRNQYLRSSALQSLRRIESLHSAAAYMRALDDPNPDNGFSAMQGLLSLAGGGSTGPIDWVPTWKQFDEAPQFYAAKCREWWKAEGKQKAEQRSAARFRRSE